MNRFVLPVITLCVCSALGWIIYQSVEYYEEDTNKGWSFLARKNPYLAGHLFLNSKAISVESVPNLSGTEKLNDVGAVFVPDARFVQLESQKIKLMNWVKNGGHLLIGANNNDDSSLLIDLGFESILSDIDSYGPAIHTSDVEINNPFISKDKTPDKDKKEDDKEKSIVEKLREQNALILERRNTKKEEQVGPICKAVLSECDFLTEPKLNENVLTELMFEGLDESIYAYFSGSYHLSHPSFFKNEDSLSYADAELEMTYWRGNKYGVTFAQLNYGDGLVSVSSSSNVFSNAKIGHFDHAFLLHTLLGNEGRILILYGRQMPPLSTLVYRYFFEALLSGLILLLVALLYFSRRFGAIISLMSNVRRSRRESMTASAQFYWRIKDETHLIDHLRNDINRKAHIRWSDFNTWDEKEKITHLMTRCDFNHESINAALYAPFTFNEHYFLNSVKVLQGLRKVL